MQKDIERLDAEKRRTDKIVDRHKGLMSMAKRLGLKKTYSEAEIFNAFTRALIAEYPQHVEARELFYGRSLDTKNRYELRVAGNGDLQTRLIARRQHNTVADGNRPEENWFLIEGNYAKRIFETALENYYERPYSVAQNILRKNPLKKIRRIAALFRRKARKKKKRPAN